jgi:hypothetical protein
MKPGPKEEALRLLREARVAHAKARAASSKASKAVLQVVLADIVAKRPVKPKGRKRG